MEAVLLLLLEAAASFFLVTPLSATTMHGIIVVLSLQSTRASFLMAASILLETLRLGGSSRGEPEVLARMHRYMGVQCACISEHVHLPGGFLALHGGIIRVQNAVLLNHEADHQYGHGGLVNIDSSGSFYCTDCDIQHSRAGGQQGVQSQGYVCMHARIFASM